jgi:hypothetical protein
VLILGGAAIFLTVCLILILMSLNFYLLGNLVYEKESLQSLEKQYQTDEFVTQRDFLRRYGLVLRAANHFYQHTLFASDILAFAASIQQPAQVAVTDINIERISDKAAFKVMVNGTSQTREALLNFKQILEVSTEQNSGTITHIDFPAENWIKPTNIRFRFSYEYEDKK